MSKPLRLALIALLVLGGGAIMVWLGLAKGEDWGEAAVFTLFVPGVMLVIAGGVMLVGAGIDGRKGRSR